MTRPRMRSLLGTPLERDDYVRTAQLLKVDVATVRALVEVESRGKGFGDDNRPIILFEPHIFYRFLPPGLFRSKAVDAGLAYKKWGTKPYFKTQASRWIQLTDAMKIQKSMALQSTSWGLGQVMGFNFEACGYPNVDAFVEDMHISEGVQLQAMARFILKNKLDRYLRDQDFAAFARKYNGPGYAQHGYDVKLASAYSHHSGESRRA